MRSLIRRISTYYAVLVLISGGIVTVCATGEPRATADPPDAPGIPKEDNSGDLAQYVRIVLDTNAKADASRVAMQHIAELPQDQRFQAYRSILDAPTSRYAFDAATFLLRENDDSSATAIATALPTFTLEQQASLLSSIWETKRPNGFIEIPRMTLRDLVDNSTGSNASRKVQRPAISDLVGVCSQLLKSSATSSDRELLLQAVRIAPDSMLAWFAVASQAQINKDTVELARSTMNNASFDKSARVGAALVVGTVDASAFRFASDELDTIVAQYKDRSVRDLVGKGRWTSLDYASFQRELVLFAAAAYVPKSMIEKTMFSAMSASNKHLSAVATYFVISRWPEQVIEMINTGQFGADDAVVRTIFSRLHPNRRAELLDSSVTENSDKAVDHRNPWMTDALPGASIARLLPTVPKLHE